MHRRVNGLQFPVILRHHLKVRITLEPLLATRPTGRDLQFFGQQMLFTDLGLKFGLVRLSDNQSG